MLRFPKIRRALLASVTGEQLDVEADWRKTKPLHVNNREVHLQDWHPTEPWVEFFMDSGHHEVIRVHRNIYEKYLTAPDWWILEGGGWRYETAWGQALLLSLVVEDENTTQWQARITQRTGKLHEAIFDGGRGTQDGFFRAQAWVVKILGLPSPLSYEAIDMIEIVPYHPRWRDEFLEIGGRIRAALGDLALRVDHIGSTSVPNLAAKDIIDIQVTVPDFMQLASIRSQLEAADFEFRFFGIYDHAPAGWDTTETEWEKAFFREREGSGQRRVNMHIRAQGRSNQRYALLFRDYLRATPKATAGYAAVKVQLARYFDDITPYVDIKDPVVDILIAQAEAWAAQTGWVMGETDL